MIHKIPALVKIKILSFYMAVFCSCALHAQNTLEQHVKQLSHLYENQIGILEQQIQHMVLFCYFFASLTLVTIFYFYFEGEIAKKWRSLKAAVKKVWDKIYKKIL